MNIKSNCTATQAGISYKHPINRFTQKPVLVHSLILNQKGVDIWN